MSGYPGIFHAKPDDPYVVLGWRGVRVFDNYDAARAYYAEGPPAPYPAYRAEHGELVSETDFRLLAQSCPPQFLARLREAAKRRYDDPYVTLMSMIDHWEGDL